mgnify:CR=1 FL=1
MKTRDDLPRFLNDRGLTGAGVEVGVCRGSFSLYILEKWYGYMLYSVDPWMHQANVDLDASNVDQLTHEENYNVTKERLRPYKRRSTILRKTSVDASKMVGAGVDFVYLDARHDYRSVMEDLRAWWPLVKRGGILSGHDYKNSFVRDNLVEVKRAVDNFGFEFGLKVESTTDDNLPSWYIIKS